MGQTAGDDLARLQPEGHHLLYRVGIPKNIDGRHIATQGLERPADQSLSW